MTPSLYIVGYNNNVVFYLTEVVGKMCFRPRGVVPFDSYTDGGHTTSTTRAFSLCSAAFFRDILCIQYMRSRTAACLVPTNATHRGHRAYLQQVYSVHNIKQCSTTTKHYSSHHHGCIGISSTYIYYIASPGQVELTFGRSSIFLQKNKTKSCLIHYPLGLLIYI